MKEKLLITFLLVCVLEGVLASGKIQCPAEDISMTLEGDDNSYVKYQNVDTYDLCGTFCARSDKCKFWTWYDRYSDSTKYDFLDCLLFESDDQLTQIDGAISGEKMCPFGKNPEPECKDCSPEPIRFKEKSLNEISFDDGNNANYVDIIEGVGESTLCGRLCAITTPCIYWTWYSSQYGKRKGNTCLMLTTLYSFSTIRMQSPGKNTVQIQTWRKLAPFNALNRVLSILNLAQIMLATPFNSWKKA